MSEVEPEQLRLGHGTSRAPVLRFVQDIDGQFEHVEIALTHRDWDVKDSSAQLRATEDELGPEDLEYHKANPSAQWFIDPDANTAALLVYRPSPGGSRGSAYPVGEQATR